MAPYDTHASLALADVATETPIQPTEQVETRFGTLAIKAEHKLEMPQGPFGFADHTRFGIADVPNTPASQFRILQSLEDANVGFVVLPVAAENDWISRADFDAACESYCFSPEHSGILLLVTMRRTATGSIDTTVNLKAPIVIDTLNQVARQIVFAGGDYPIRHPLDVSSAT